MNTRTLNDRECADIVDEYDRGNSYDTIARDFGIKPGRVQTIMRRCSPGSIRKQGQQKKLAVVKEYGLTLAALGQMRVGRCRSCGIPLVAKRRCNPVKGQTCGLCRANSKGMRAA